MAKKNDPKNTLPTEEELTLQPVTEQDNIESEESVELRRHSFNERQDQLYKDTSKDGKMLLNAENSFEAEAAEKELFEAARPSVDESGVPLPEQNALEMSPEEAAYQDLLDGATRDLDNELKYGDKDIQALLTGAASSATLGLSDQFLVRSGIYSQEELNAIRQVNKLAGIAGEVAGFFTPGAPIKAITKGGRAAQKAYLNAIEKASKGANKKAVQSILRRARGVDAGSAVEGAAFATGQLISEQALGNAEFNAENFISAAGQGLILGGALGTAFNATQGAVGFGVNAVGKTAQQLKNKLKLGQNAESVNSKVWQLTGASADDIARLKTQNPELFENGFKFFSNNKAFKTSDLTAVQTGRTLDSVMRSVREESMNSIDRTIKGLDDVYSKFAPNSTPSLASHTQNVLRRIDDEIFAPLRINGELTAQGVKVAKKYESAIKRLQGDLTKTNSLKPSQLHQLRKGYQENVDWSKPLVDMTPEERIYAIATQDLGNTVKKLATDVKRITDDSDLIKLSDELLEANLNFRMSTEALKHIPKKIQRAEAAQVIEPMTAMTVAMGLVTGNWTVTGGILGAQFLASEYFKKLRILSYTERANQAVNRSVSKAANNIVKKGSTRGALVSADLAKPATNNFLQSITFAPGEKPANDESQVDAYRRLYAKMSAMASNPTQLEQDLTFRMAAMGSAAPETATAVMGRIEQSLNFLMEKAPKPPTSQGAMLQPKLRLKNFTPSDQELAKFARYLKATMNPGSILDSISEKNISTEEVEVLQRIYPDLYNRVRVAVMDKVQEMDEELDYSSKLQLGILFNLPTDPSLEPKKVMQFQSLYGAGVGGPQPLAANQGVSGAQDSITQGVTTAVQPTQGALRNLEVAERAETGTNRVANRR